MKKIELSRVLIAPFLSEKANRCLEKENAAVFWVNPKANKGEIKQAVESFFTVKVKSVRTQIKGRQVIRFGKMQGQTKKRKKAYVKLAPGSQINLEEKG